MDSATEVDRACPSLRIGLVSPLPPQVGGVARVADWLLSNQSRIGCDYVLFDLPRSSQDEIGGRLRLGSVPYQLALLLRFLRWLRTAPRVVHVAVSGSVSGLLRDIVLVVAARASGRRVIAHVHSHHDGAARRARLFHVPALRLAARLSSECVALGPTAARELRRSGVACRWIYNPVAIVGNEAPTRPAAEPGALRLLYVGAYGGKKGTSDLISALARVRQAGVDVTLCVVGRAMYRDEHSRVAQQVAAHELGDVVTFAGEREPAEIPSFHASADVICMPSLQEGLPMALLEGMAAGLPALATGVGCIPDVVEPGRSGLLVRAGDVGELADGIAFFAADPVRRRKMGEAAQSRARTVGSPEKIAAEWRELYAAVAADGGS